MIELKEGEIPQIHKQGDYAIVAITKHGVEIARKLHQCWIHKCLEVKAHV